MAIVGCKEFFTGASCFAPCRDQAILIFFHGFQGVLLFLQVYKLQKYEQRLSIDARPLYGVLRTFFSLSLVQLSQSVLPRRFHKGLAMALALPPKPSQGIRMRGPPFSPGRRLRENGLSGFVFCPYVPSLFSLSSSVFLQAKTRRIHILQTLHLLSGFS